MLQVTYKKMITLLATGPITAIRVVRSVEDGKYRFQLASDENFYETIETAAHVPRQFFALYDVFETEQLTKVKMESINVK